MVYFLHFLLAILLTALSYFFGSRIISGGVGVLQAIIIGSSVVTLGALTEALRAPIWLIVLVPFPVGMLLLFLFLHEPLHTWFFTYLITLALYSVIHIAMSYFFNYHSLIPSWRLS